MCGLFGIINTQPQKFDKRAFCVLGINNDIRGGDSCGIFIDGKVEYGTNDKKLFINFLEDSELINDTNQCKIALGHCRKASVGGVSDEKAQPCIVRDNDGKIVFVVTHNGTIKNYQDLAKKYIPEINITNLTDSQVMTLIFYHKGFDVLNEYIGTGAFIIADYREAKPCVYMFHGKSLQYKTSVTTTEERPLFFVESNGSVIYSSIADFLYGLFPNNKVYYIVHNKLAKFDRGRLVIKAEYDRTKCTQTESTVVYGRASYYDDDEYGAYYRSSKVKGGEEAKNTSAKRGKLTMDDWFTVRLNGGVSAHGPFLVDSTGSILSEEEGNNNPAAKRVYVFNGILLKNKECFDVLTNIHDAWGMGYADFYEIMPNLIMFFGAYPFKNYSITKDYKARVFTDVDNSEEFTGDIPMIFSTTMYHYKNGVREYSSSFVSLIESFSYLDQFKNYEIPRQILIEYLNDFV